MTSKIYIILTLIYLWFELAEPLKNIFRAVSDNDGIFDHGFTTTYVAEEPFSFEHYLFIKKDFWKIKQKNKNEREVCIIDLESQQHNEFDAKFTLSFSYLSDHMVQHSDELNLTNHVLMQFSIASSIMFPEFESHEIIEAIFDANHKNLHYMVAGNYFVYPIPYYNASVAFQPQSFTDDEHLDGPNFVFLQQNHTDDGYVRASEVHSIINETVFRNTSDQFGQYIPAFIQSIDPHLYVNVILPMRLDKENEDKSAVILIVHDNGLIKYCVTEEQELHESCKPSNLKQLLGCHTDRDEL